MEKINFTKAVASGNDFVVFDNRAGGISAFGEDAGAVARELCIRKFGIGADGILLLENSKRGDLKMRIINSDGSEAAMCGNGARCAALYAFSRQWCASEFTIETGAGVIGATVRGDIVKIKMTDPFGLTLNKKITIDDQQILTHFINSGVPHAVTFTEELADYPVNVVGRKIRFHSAFAPSGTNANFVQVINQSAIKVRTYERGVEGETQACGTGSVASAIIAHLVKGVNQPVNVETASGEELTIYFSISDDVVSGVYMEGQARLVFDGDYILSK